MNSTSICSKCLRALRQAQKVHSTALPHSPRSSRALSTTTAKPAQPVHQQRQPIAPPPIPITTSTITSNSTADAPPPSSPSPKTISTPSSNSEPSTSQIQKHLRSSLTRPTLSSRLARTLSNSGSSVTETYATYGITEALFKSCSSVVEYTIPPELRTKILTGEGPPKDSDGADIGVPTSSSISSIWFTSLNLKPTFSTWSQVTYLHMYLLLTSLRTLPSPSSLHTFQLYILEHFSQSAEEKMELLHTLSSRSIRNQYLKDLFIQWRGIIAAYDEGMIKGDAVLGGAVWRNLFKGGEDVDWEKVGRVVGFMRSVVRELGKVESVRELPGKLDGVNGIWAKAWREVDMVEKGSRGIGEAIE